MRTEAERQELGLIWDMILAVDYQAVSAEELSPEAREDFYDVIEVLLRTLARD
ncbi:hypothetical protein V6L77_23020 [Pannonibacter sp. Pt2-lr]